MGQEKKSIWKKKIPFDFDARLGRNFEKNRFGVGTKLIWGRENLDFDFDARLRGKFGVKNRFVEKKIPLFILMQD